MTNRKTIMTTTLLIVLIASMIVTFGQTRKQRFKPGDMTIAEIAVTNGSFNTLVAALVCADLVGAVSNPDAELTVFAPTDGAFAGLGLTPANICTTFDEETLATILLYHVVGERRPSPSVINGKNKQIEMLAAGSIYPDGKGSTVVRDNLDRPVTIVMPDVMASNGIIHVVSDVLLPVAP